MKAQTKEYVRWRRAGAVVVALALAGAGAAYIGELVSPEGAPASHAAARGLSLVADRLPGLAHPTARAAEPKSKRPKARGPKQPVVRASQAQTRSSRPAAPASAPTRTRLRTRFGPASMARDILAAERDTVTGSLEPRLQGRQVLLQVRQHERWWTVGRTRTGARSRYELSYEPTASETLAMRVLFPGGATSKPTQRRLGLLNVYRLAVASWYGGGGVTACGAILTSSTLGVANKTLPCGTMVTLRYDGRSVRVPVIDRGPFVPGRDFDLTEATKAALGFEGVGDVWTIY